MGLETGTFISDLNANNPVGATDPKSQGDDHIRLIKSTMLNTFPNITGAMNASHTELNNLVGVTGKTGTGNIVLSDSPTLTGTLMTGAITASGIISGNGSGLTTLNASELDTGLIPDARVQESNVTQHQSALAIAGSQITSGTIADARLSSNIPLKNALNVFTSEQRIDSAGPNFLVMHENDGAVDEKQWAMRIAGGFRLSTMTDAGAFGSNAIQVNRSGTNIGSMDINASVLNLLGDISLSGTRAIDATTRLNLTGATVSVGESGGILGFFGGAGATKQTVTATLGGTDLAQAIKDLAAALDANNLIVDNITIT